jgi:hypothetical protein
MASSDSELRGEVRGLTDYSTAVLDQDELKSVVSRAKKHIRVKKSVQTDFDFYAEEARESALFWYTCFFAKVSVGEIDGGEVQIGTINIDTTSSSDDDEVTTWLRNARDALDAIDSGGAVAYGTGISSVTRDNRTYGEGSTGSGTGTGDAANL